MKPVLLVSFAIIGMLYAVSVPIARPQLQARPEQLSSNEALSLVRTLATIEAEKKDTERSFVSLQKLLPRVMQSRQH